MCSVARDWSDDLSKVVRHSALEAAVGQHTQSEPDSLWNLEPVQSTEHGVVWLWSDLLAEKTSRTATFRNDWSRCSRTSGAPAITELQESIPAC